MKVKFKNNVEKNCTAPVEQKLFRNSQEVGWVLMFNITDTVTSGDVDTFLTTENASELTFTDNEGVTLFELDGYDKISSSIIRHSEAAGETRLELQLTKGV